MYLRTYGILGHLLGLNTFTSPDADAAIEKSIQTATQNDCKVLKDTAHDLINCVLQGQNPNDSLSEVRQVVVECIEHICSHFQNVVIRQTGKSKDYKDCSIIGLPPYKDISILLDLYKPEMEYLHKVAQELLQQKDAGLQFGIGKVSKS